MLFNKKIEPSCAYCEYGSRIGETEIACLKRGIVSAASSCRGFKYDPIRREPPNPMSIETGRFAEEDFII